MLAGGAASRFGGTDKILAVVDGKRLLDRALAAVGAATRIVAVGPPRPATAGVRWVREEPPGGGPVAALAAGLLPVEEPTTVLLAADLPFVAPGHVEHLLDALAAAPTADGVMFVDPAGRDQPLLSAWRTAGLRRVLPEQPEGAGLRRVLAPLRISRLVGGADVRDCDTPADLEAARRLAEGSTPARRAGADPGR